jgi:hypothetical protein
LGRGSCVLSTKLEDFMNFKELVRFGCITKGRPALGAEIKQKILDEDLEFFVSVIDRRFEQTEKYWVKPTGQKEALKFSIGQGSLLLDISYALYPIADDCLDETENISEIQIDNMYFDKNELEIKIENLNSVRRLILNPSLCELEIDNKKANIPTSVMIFLINFSEYQNENKRGLSFIEYNVKFNYQIEDYKSFQNFLRSRKSLWIWESLFTEDPNQLSRKLVIFDVLQISR